MPDITIPTILLLDGLVCVLMSVFAHKIGLDTNQTLGRTRLTILLLGIVLIFIASTSASFKTKKPRFLVLLRSESIKVAFSLIHLWGIIILIYIWLVTFGNFTTWNHTTHYYTQLANAFEKAQLYVDQKPGKALAEAFDPYHPTDRPPFSDEVWDMSLYEGKLYLYWGPVPALLITPIQMIFTKKITDNYLVFFFFVSLLIVNSLIIIKLRRTFFPNVSALNMLVLIALIGLILPISWSLSTPYVYEAAIGAGQFFLIGGIYFIISSVKKEWELNRTNLFLAGVFLAFSVGSRAINVFSVIFLVVLTSSWTAGKMKKPYHWRKYIHSIFALYLPLVIGAILIGWYNWSRFNSALEFGLRYQITIFNLNKDMNLVFRPEYFFLNIYTYLFQPFQIIPKFPFIQPPVASAVLGTYAITAPYLYAAGRATGVLFSAPFLVFSLVHLFPVNKDRLAKRIPENFSHYNFTIWLLAGSFLINFLCLLLYFFGQVRFLVDVVSQISLLAIIGYWQIYDQKKYSSSLVSKLVVFLANVLIVITISAGLLLSLTGEANRMQTLNPTFFDHVNFFLSKPD